MRAENPNLQEPPWHHIHQQPPSTLDILDMIEFCWRAIGKPVRGSYHDYFSHYHLRFEVEVGRNEFRDAVNRIFRRNGLAYELTSGGTITRLAPTVLREELASAQFQTGDAELDRLLETARRKFLNPDEATRREALETLWDAWERLKTLGAGADKKAQTTALLDAVSGELPRFREALEREAKELTWLGNNLRIRHSETSQERLSRSEHVDYLFHRLLSLLQMVLRTHCGA
jgi:AbiJ N-terminal domain 4